VSRYHIELTDNDRLTLIMALGCFAGSSIDNSFTFALAERLIDLAPQPEIPMPRESKSAPATSDVSPAPVEAPKPPAGEIQITPVIVINSAVKMGIATKKERIFVKWEGGQASCWLQYKAIWPRLIERVKNPKGTILKLEKSGDYFNIVGVKAPV
jgi:hypothetical protein